MCLLLFFIPDQATQETIAFSQRIENALVNLKDFIYVNSPAGKFHCVSDVTWFANSVLYQPQQVIPILLVVAPGDSCDSVVHSFGQPTHGAAELVGRLRDFRIVVDHSLLRSSQLLLE